MSDTVVSPFETSHHMERRLKARLKGSFPAICIKHKRAFYQYWDHSWHQQLQRLMPFWMRRACVRTWNAVACRIMGHEATRVEKYGFCCCGFEASDYGEKQTSLNEMLVKAVTEMLPHVEG